MHTTLNQKNILPSTPENNAKKPKRNPIQRKLNDKMSFLPYRSATKMHTTLPITKNTNKTFMSNIAYYKPTSYKKIGILKIYIAIAPLALKLNAQKTHIQNGIL